MEMENCKRALRSKRKDRKGRNLRSGEDQMPDGRYRYRYTDAGGIRHAVYSWRLASTDPMPSGKRQDVSLREKENILLMDQEEGINGLAAAKITLNDMFQRYISGKYELKQSTRTNYQYMYRKYVSENLGRKKLTVIKYSDIRNFYNSMIYEQGFQVTSAEIFHTILHPVFTMAVRDGYLRANPAAGVMSEIKKRTQWEKSRRTALTVEEQDVFIGYIKQSARFERWLPLITFFLGTGCRIGEVIGLRWQDCDFGNNTISINHNLVYRLQDNGKCEMHITTPKTSAGCRTIPMLKAVRAALLAEQQRQCQQPSAISIDGYDNFVFTNRHGNVHNPQTINQALERIRLACNAAEVKSASAEGRDPVRIRHFSAHNLRHTFCTRFCENETNIKVIQEIMGHSDIGTTMNIYAEATENKKRACLESLEEKIRIS